MKNNNLRDIVGLSLIIVVLFGLIFAIFTSKGNNTISTENVKVRSIGSEILAEGIVKSQNEATLNFQIGGKLVYLPFKEGDVVQQGQIIAQLDTYTLQKQLEASLASFRYTRSSFDQNNTSSKNGVLQGSQQFSLETQNKVGTGGQNETDIINDMVKNILNQNQANLDSAVINVQIANDALQLSNLYSPINGTIIHEDVTTPYVNITPMTSFTIADQSAIKFQANISEQDIDFVSMGSQAKISLNNNKNKSFSGYVSKIYPEKITLSNGNQVYKLDILSDELSQSGKLDQSGSVTIQNNVSQKVILVPRWTVLANDYIWVMKNNKPELKKINVGKIHDSTIEIIDGLNDGEQIITNPESIVRLNYSTL